MGRRASERPRGAAALIVFGGTIAAVIVSFPATRLRTIPARSSWPSAAQPFVGRAD